jgi:GxxExxY protein
MYKTKSELDELTYKINAACIEVHKKLGPGLLESVYHECLKIEFDLRNIEYKSEMEISIDYKGNDVEIDFRCDFLI